MDVSKQNELPCVGLLFSTLLCFIQLDDHCSTIVVVVFFNIQFFYIFVKWVDKGENQRERL